jgi:hypothetical protein
MRLSASARASDAVIVSVVVRVRHELPAHEP